MKKTIYKKIIGGTLIVVFLATLGAVLVTADTNDTTNDESTYPRFECDRHMGWHHPYFSELSEEQQEEINDLRQQLIEEDATPEEIREAINDKLAEFGIELPDRDEILDEQIEQATQCLEILKLQKQLREEGKSWEEIEVILAEDYNVTIPSDHHSMMDGRGMYGLFEDTYPLNDDTEDSDI